MAGVPKTIGRYEVVRLIAGGGMGEVYLARDPEIDRLVAIKIILQAEDTDRDELRKRFAKERQRLGKLRHINIVTIFDSGLHEGEPFIAMEYVQGQTLGDLIRARPPLPLPRRVEIIEGVCAGLHHAHLQGIVHRDIKPANVMVDSAGTVKILDFGIARVSSGPTGGSGSTGMIGTLRYMSPEQLRGESVDARSDVFSLGAVLYEVISGKAAFPEHDDAGRALVSRILLASHIPIQHQCPDLDQELADVVTRTLDRDPAGRYPDMDALRQDLLACRRRQIGRSATDTLTMARPPRWPVPTPPPRAMSHPHATTQLEDVARLRTERISSQLNEARSALEVGEFERAIEASKQALIINPDEDQARSLLDQAVDGLQKRQLQGWLGEASELVKAGSLTAATQLVERVLAVRPSMAEALEKLQAIADARYRLEEQFRKSRELEDAIERASRHLEAGDLDLAAQAVDQALAVDPRSQHAIGVRAAIAAKLEARQHEERAREVVRDARSRFSAGHHDIALGLLRDHRPSSSIVSETLRSLELELREFRRRDEAKRRAAEAEVARQRQAAAAAIAAEAEATRRLKLARELADREATVSRQGDPGPRLRLPLWVAFGGVAVAIAAGTWLLWPRPQLQLTSTPTKSADASVPAKPIADAGTGAADAPTNRGSGAGPTVAGRGTARGPIEPPNVATNAGSGRGAAARPSEPPGPRPAATPATDDPEVAVHIAEGERHLAKGELREAQIAFQKAVSLDRSNGKAQTGLQKTREAVKKQVDLWLSEAKRRLATLDYCEREQVLKIYGLVLNLDPTQPDVKDLREALQGRQRQTQENWKTSGLPARRCDGGG